MFTFYWGWNYNIDRDDYDKYLAQVQARRLGLEYSKLFDLASAQVRGGVSCLNSSNSHSICGQKSEVSTFINYHNVDVF